MVAIEREDNVEPSLTDCSVLIDALVAGVYR
jgi:hypothetical protein